MTTEEEMKRMEQEMEARQEKAMINPDALADAKDTVGAGVNSGSESGAADTAGTDEQQNDPNLAARIEDKKSQIEAAGGVVNITPSSYFKGKAKQFELLKSLDKQLDKALQAKSPEELATNLFWAVLSAPFDTLNAYMDHRKAEKERLQKEYDEKTAAHDRELGVKTKDKFITGWMETIKILPPEYQQYVSKDGTLDVKKMPKDALKNIKNMVLKNPNIRKALEIKCERQIEDKEWKKIVDGMFSFVGEKRGVPAKEKPKETTADIFKEIVNGHKEIIKQGKELHAEMKNFGKLGDVLNDLRKTLENLRNNRSNGGFNSQSRGRDNGR